MLDCMCTYIWISVYFAGDDDVVIVRTKRKNTATIGLLVHAAGMYVYVHVCMYACVCIIVQIFVYI